MTAELRQRFRYPFEQQDRMLRHLQTRPSHRLGHPIIERPVVTLT